MVCVNLELNGIPLFMSIWIELKIACLDAQTNSGWALNASLNIVEMRSFLHTSASLSQEFSILPSIPYQDLPLYTPEGLLLSTLSPYLQDKSSLLIGGVLIFIVITMILSFVYKQNLLIYIYMVMSMHRLLFSGDLDLSRDTKWEE